MGSCFVCEYITLRIKERDRLGKVFRSDVVKFKLPMPIYHESEQINLKKLHLDVSACIIAGLDPRSVLSKECQDSVLYLQKDSIFLAAVFDGHGIDGSKVVEFTKDYIKKYFMHNTVAFTTAPTESITYMITEIDKKIRNSSSGIDCSISGTTAVILIITDVIHVGSVGDSRAILAILGASDPNYIPGKRHVDPSRLIFPMKLTVDQKPNLREELERIKKAGGKVQQLTNEQGVKIGPYRV